MVKLVKPLIPRPLAMFGPYGQSLRLTSREDLGGTHSIRGWFRRWSNPKEYWWRHWHDRGEFFHEQNPFHMVFPKREELRFYCYLFYGFRDDQQLAAIWGHLRSSVKTVPESAQYNFAFLISRSKTGGESKIGISFWGASGFGPPWQNAPRVAPICAIKLKIRI